MKEESKKVIETVLSLHYNEAMAKLLHFQHQLSLPSDFRILDLEEEEIQEGIKAYKEVVEEYKSVIEELNPKTPQKPSWEK